MSPKSSAVCRQCRSIYSSELGYNSIGISISKIDRPTQRVARRPSFHLPMLHQSVS